MSSFCTGAWSRKLPNFNRFKSCVPTFLTVAMTSAVLLAGARVTSSPVSRFPLLTTAASPMARTVATATEVCLKCILTDEKRPRELVSSDKVG